MLLGLDYFGAWRDIISWNMLMVATTHISGPKRGVAGVRNQYIFSSCFRGFVGQLVQSVETLTPNSPYPHHFTQSMIGLWIHVYKWYTGPHKLQFLAPNRHCVIYTFTRARVSWHTWTLMIHDISTGTGLQVYKYTIGSYVIYVFIQTVSTWNDTVQYPREFRNRNFSDDDRQETVSENANYLSSSAEETLVWRTTATVDNLWLEQWIYIETILSKIDSIYEVLV